MGVKPVDGYGNITSGNAKEIYLKWKHGEIDLEVSQQKYCESFLSPQDWDEIEYDIDANKNDGKNSINTDNTKSHDGALAATVGAETAGVAAAVGGTIAAIVGKTVKDAETGAVTNGFCSLLAAGFALAGSAVALAFSFENVFDPDIDDRKSHKEANGSNIETIDNYNNSLVESMDMMNEDMANYDAKSQEYMVTVNSTNADLASLQVQLADAEAAGDTQGAADVRTQITALQGQNFEGEEEELQGMRDGLEEYRAMGSESAGAVESGRSVSAFLQVGKTLSPIATVNGALLAVGSAALGIATLVGAIPKIAPFFPDTPAALSSTVIWGAAAAMMGGAATKMFINAHTESECGESGTELEDHVNDLNDIVTEQTGYVEETEGFYGEADEARAEDNVQGETMANDNSTSNGGAMIHVDPSAKNNPFAPANSGTKAQDKS